MTGETAMNRTCGEKDGGRRSNENMEVIGHRKIGRQRMRRSGVRGALQRKKIQKI